MIEREILIANNRDQSKYRIVTGAETLGELQDAIARNEGVSKMVGNAWVSNPTPINISGLTFTEGITKTQLISRDSALPTNVQFKGQFTNNLVMLLTNTNKQIRSGAEKLNRPYLYHCIRTMGLQDAVKARFGKNFTMVSSADLDAIIREHQSDTQSLQEVRKELKDQKKVEEVVNTPASEKKLPDVKKAPHAQTVEWFYCGIKAMVKDNTLAIKDIIILADLLTELALRLEEEKPKITTSDMDDMIKSIRH